MRELSAAIILFTSETKVISVLIYDLNESGDLGAISVIGLGMLIITFSVVIAVNRIPGFGSVQLMKLPFRFSNATVELASRIARFGEDNAAVLRKYLGYDDRQIDALAKERVIVLG